MLTDQWQCKCSTWNSVLRNNCRECSGSQSEAINTEGALQTISRIVGKSAEELTAGEFPTRDQAKLN